MNNLKAKRKGFTLVELVVVMAIIGILVLLVVPRFSVMTDSARSRTTEANLRTLVSAYSMYMADNAGKAPTALSNLMGAAPAAIQDLNSPPTPEGAVYSYDSATKTLTAVYTYTSTVGKKDTYTWDPINGFKKS